MQSAVHVASGMSLTRRNTNGRIVADSNLDSMSLVVDVLNILGLANLSSYDAITIRSKLWVLFQCLMANRRRDIAFVIKEVSLRDGDLTSSALIALVNVLKDLQHRAFSGFRIHLHVAYGNAAGKARDDILIHRLSARFDTILSADQYRDYSNYTSYDLSYKTYDMDDVLYEWYNCLDDPFSRDPAFVEQSTCAFIKQLQKWYDPADIEIKHNGTVHDVQNKLIAPENVVIDSMDCNEY